MLNFIKIYAVSDLEQNNVPEEENQAEWDDLRLPADEPQNTQTSDKWARSPINLRQSPSTKKFVQNDWLTLAQKTHYPYPKQNILNILSLFRGRIPIEQLWREQATVFNVYDSNMGKPGIMNFIENTVNSTVLKAVSWNRNQAFYNDKGGCDHESSKLEEIYQKKGKIGHIQFYGHDDASFFYLFGFWTIDSRAINTQDTINKYKKYFSDYLNLTVFGCGDTFNIYFSPYTPILLELSKDKRFIRLFKHTTLTIPFPNKNLIQPLSTNKKPLILEVFDGKIIGSTNNLHYYGNIYFTDEQADKPSLICLDTSDLKLGEAIEILLAQKEIIEYKDEREFLDHTTSVGSATILRVENERELIIRLNQGVVLENGKRYVAKFK